MAGGGINSPIAASENWFIGEDRTLAYSVVDEDGDPQVMTGWSLSWTLAPRQGQEAVLTKTVGSGITVSNGDGVNDLATVVVSDSDTEGLEKGPGTYYAELRRTDAGFEAVLSYGTVVLKQAQS